jgi:hypothetical protein
MEFVGIVVMAGVVVINGKLRLNSEPNYLSYHHKWHITKIGTYICQNVFAYICQIFLVITKNGAYICV